MLERLDNEHQSHSAFHISHFSFLIFSLLCACASNRAVATNSSTEIPADIAGLVHAGETNTPEEYALLDRMGASWFLATFRWSRIQPSENQWDFESYDLYVDTAKAAGKKVFGVLGYDVSWIHDDGKSSNYIPPDKIDLFLDYTRRTAEHFRGKVDAWCIWNEPNFHFWKGSKEEFFELTRRAADAIQESDPGVTIAGGAFNRGIFGLPKKYIQGIFESGAMRNIDVIAFHPYELNPARAAKLYGDFRALSAGYGFAGRIWVTEVGYPTGGWYPTKVPEKKLPEYVVKTFVNLAALGAQKIFWYELFDPVNRTKSNSEEHFGLVKSANDHTSKGAEAFRLCAVHLAGTVYRPDFPPLDGLPASLKTFYFEKPEGGGTLVLWKQGTSAKVSLRLISEDNGGVLTVNDVVSGDVIVAAAEAVLKIGATPVFVTWENEGEIRIGK